MCSVRWDNGSIGFEGNVLDMLKSEIESGRLMNLDSYDIYVVGPHIMMKSVSEYFEKLGLYCQVSLESPMACGMGVCQGCAVKKRDEEDYFLICKDGPVFSSKDVVL